MSLKSILFLLASALANIIGAWLFLLRKQWEHESLRLWIGAGAGFMLAVSFVEIMPEAAERTESAPAWVLVGFLFVHLFEHVLTPHFHYGHEGHHGLGTHVSLAATTGLVMHSITDGIAIVAALQVDAALGWLVLVAAVWHKVPAGFTAASVVAATGGSRRSSMLAAGFVGAGAILGGVIFAAVSVENWLGPALAVSAGSLIYVAGTDLLPEVNKRRSLLAPVGVMLGVGVFYLTHLVMGH